jgi:hypothetical protein
MKRYFTDLGFLPAVEQKDLTLGAAAARRRWTLLAYLAFSAGIFARQLVPFPRVVAEYANLRWSTLAGSLIIGLALFPPLMKWINSKRRKPSAQHLVSAFSYGFFIDLAAAGVAFAAKAANIIR